MQNLRASISRSFFTFQAQVLDLKLNAFFQEWVLSAVSEICQEEEKMGWLCCKDWQWQ
jgi:hypothetical protein